MRKSTSQEKLLCLLKAKDKKGFDLIYEQYAKVLYDISFKVVRNQNLAEDILQDSFVKIWLHIADYDASKGTLFTWILNITRNTAIDKTRSIAFKQEKLADPISTQSGIVDQFISFEQRIDGIGLDRYLKTLAPQQQIVLDYVYGKGYTHQETADALQLPLGTVKSRVKAALKQLRVRLI